MRIPSKQILKKFDSLMNLDIEKAVYLLCNYYKVPRVNLIFDGRKVGDGHYGCFDWEGVPTIILNYSHLTDRTVLHEFFHYVSWIRKYGFSEKEDEREANRFAREFLKSMKATRKIRNNHVVKGRLIRLLKPF